MKEITAREWNVPSPQYNNMKEITAREWNVFIASSILAAMVKGQVLLAGPYQLPMFMYYSLELDSETRTSVHVESSAFFFSIFLLAGAIVAWIALKAKEEAEDTGEGEETNEAEVPMINTEKKKEHVETYDVYKPLMLVGISCWLIGFAVQACIWQLDEDDVTLALIQVHYATLLLIHGLLVSFGGGLYYWAVFFHMMQELSLTAPRELLMFALHMFMPSIYMLFVIPYNYPMMDSSDGFNGAYIMVLISSVGFVLLVAFWKLVGSKQSEDAPAPALLSCCCCSGEAPETPVVKVSKVAIMAHLLTVFFFMVGFFVPFSQMTLYAAQNPNYSTLDARDGMLLMVGGALIGDIMLVIAVGTGRKGSLGLRVIAPILLVTYALTMTLWAFIAPDEVDPAAFKAAMFFLGFAACSSFSAALVQSISFDSHAVLLCHMLVMIPGTYIFDAFLRQNIVAGVVDFHPPLLNAALFGWSAVVCSIVASVSVAKGW
jgi:hypothetical protein